jgi:hypothetical protein
VLMMLMGMGDAFLPCLAARARHFRARLMQMSSFSLSSARETAHFGETLTEAFSPSRIHAHNSTTSISMEPILYKIVAYIHPVQFW